MRHFLLVLAGLFSSGFAYGQTYTISTIAGGGLPVNVPGTSASLDFDVPLVVAADRSGNLFFVDQATVLRLDAVTGLLTAVAGNGTTGFSGDGGPATSAQMYLLSAEVVGLAVDSAGNLYVSDVVNNRIRKVSNGIITTVAGNGTAGFSGDNGPATSAGLSPGGLVVDSSGNLYCACNGRVRMVSNGVITTVAGNGTGGFRGDNGPATSAQISPSHLAVDSARNLYIGDSINQRIRKVSNGTITTVAGNGTYGFSGDGGPATSAELEFPEGIAVDSAGNLYIADDYSRVRKVSNGVITTFAGGGAGSGGDGGAPTAIALSGVFGLAVDGAGSVYIGEADSGAIRKVSGGVITTVAGNGRAGFSGDGGAAVSAQLNYPWGTAVDSARNLYIADCGNGCIRRVSGGVITTVAGYVQAALSPGGFSGDNGPAISAQLNGPEGVVTDSAGNLYIADYLNDRVRKVSNGIITTFAGNGTYGFSGDGGSAASAQLDGPAAVAVDSAGNLYIADQGNNRVRKVSNGIITTVAGNGTAGFRGDNGPATSAELSAPVGVAVDSAGNLYIADSQNQRIRRVSNGIITTIAGNGTIGSGGDDGPATSAELFSPTGVAVDSAGVLFVTEGLGPVRKVANGIITTVAGTLFPGFSGDEGLATGAQLDQPAAAAVDSAGNVYIADTINGRIRLLQPPPAINSGGILNAASAAVGAPVAPGSIATVYGSFLVSSLSTAPSAPLPDTLGGVSLQFGSSLNAPLFAVSGGQINLQVPWELAGQSKTAISAAIKGQTSATQTLNLATYAPGLFSINGQGTGQGAILDTSYNLINSSDPATAGATVLQIYCTGLGPVSNQPASGAAASGSQLSQTTSNPTVTIGGVQASVLFSGLAPGSVGEYQVDALVPSGSSKGGSVPVIISIGGATSNTVTISVQYGSIRIRRPWARATDYSIICPPLTSSVSPTT